MLRFLCLCLFFCGHTVWVTAQDVQRRQDALADYERALQLIDDDKPERAAKYLRQALDHNPELLPARRLLGMTHELARNYPAAAREYIQVLRGDSLFSRLLYFQTGEVLYKSGKPEQALRFYSMFHKLQGRDVKEFGFLGEQEERRERVALERLSDRVRAARITNDSSLYINTTRVYNVGFPVNTQQNDYFPFLSNDRESALLTRQGDGGDEDLIRARRKGVGEEWFTSRFGSFNTTQIEGMCTFIRDGETVYFTLCHEETSQGGCDIYTGFLIGDRIRDVTPLPDYVNSSTWDSQAAISCDGQQLFFASTRPGGLGGSDIYTCYKLPDNSWSEPKNLGDGVNTPYNEEAPFLSNDGQTLYFSSEGHTSLGDQDIFFSWWDDSRDRWTPALSLGPPVNSPHRELGFHLSSDGKTGYFASNRPGGRGGLDIYRFELSRRLSGEPITYLSGFVLDSLTGEPITDQAVRVEEGATYYTNYAGRFFICAPSEKAIPLSVTAQDYLEYQREFAVPAWENLEPYRIDLLLQRTSPPPAPAAPPPPPADTVRRKVRITKRNLTVRFSFDDASLTSVQIQNINNFVELVKDKNIERITVTGYTDSVGEDDYNIRLSQERAKAVGVHLQAAGITANEFNIRGVGEIPGRENRELNRKVEVLVRIRELVPVE